MALDRLDDVWDWIQVQAKRVPRPKKFSFIVLHYIYLIMWAIVGSILIFPVGGIPYIDALFFASGAATQSGLNTVNVNDLKMSQQIFLYMIPMFTNPIVIHGAVVFVRLYWFEKRFQHVVQDAMNWRSSRTRSRTNTQMNEERNKSVADEGVRGRSIVVLHDQARKIKPGDPPDTKDGFLDTEPESSATSEVNNEKAKEEEEYKEPRSDGTANSASFTKQGSRSSSLVSGDIRLPEPRSTEQHIAFVERQRNPKDKGALRIPGPRDFDRGEVPERVDDGLDNEDLDKVSTNPRDFLQKHESARSSSRVRLEEPIKRNITIDEPARRRLPPIQTINSRVTFGPAVTTGSQAVIDADAPLQTPRLRPRANTFSSFLKSSSTQRDQPAPYLSWQPTIGRNSAFVDLTEEQREELGGVEYRSLKTLAVILISYFFFWHLLGVIIFVPWILLTSPYTSIVTSDGVTAVWWGIFSPQTLFNDVGFTLTPDSFISFNQAVLPLILGSLLIVVGNTGFPCMLRFWIWVLQTILPRSSATWEELRFLLDHPRRCFTLLFPSAATWTLFAILVLLNGIDLIFFIILDLNDDVVQSLPPGFRFLCGLFQATSTRTSGTAVVNLAELHPGIQVSYLIMMYISVFPIAISMRRTNVYEERSLGVYSSEDYDDADEGDRSYVGTHLRKQLSFDLWFIFLGLFIIAIAEGSRIADPVEPDFNLFSCLFEIVSAYGTVGLSLGYTGIDASFSAEFTVISKLVIIAMMIRGRHRGLPYELDRAILLPSENLNKNEDRDATRRNRRLSVSSLQAAGAAENESTVAHSSGREHHMFQPRMRHDVGKVMADIARADSAVREGMKEGKEALRDSIGGDHKR